MGSFDEHHAVPVIVRGEGCYVYDEHGKRYLDGLSALYCVNVGYGRAELGEAAAEQAKELPFFTNWSYAHPPSIELAARVAEPRARATSTACSSPPGGSEAVESAWKLAKAYHAAQGEPRRHKLVSRKLAYHGTSMGALTATGLTPLRVPFEPLTPGGIHVPNTNSYRWQEGRDPLWAADAIEEAIEFEGPETVAAVILEPVQNGGGCFVPQDGYFQRVREICDRHGVLLISDEVICSWGRLGHWFGCERYDYQPDMITTAKGISSAYAPLGRGDRRRPHRRAVPARQRRSSATASRSAVTRWRARLGSRTSRSSSARSSARARAAPTRAPSARCSSSLRDLPIVGDVRGAGYFQAIELVKDKDTKETFNQEESEQLLRGFLSGELYERGLICRTDDRGDPIVQLSPPLIAGEQQFEEIEAILRPVLSEASERMERWSSLSKA